MPLELTQPWLLLGLLALLFLWWYNIHGLTDFSRWQRILSTVVRGLVVVLLVLALSGLTWYRSTKDVYVVFAVDESLSIGDEAKPVVDTFLSQAIAESKGNRYGFVRFGAQPGPVLPDRNAAATIDRQGTNIAAVLETAAAAIPPEYIPRIVLLSDGNQTSGDAVRAALSSRARISTVPLPVRSEPEVQVSTVNVPSQVREGEPFFVEVVLDSNHDDEGQIEVFRGAHKVIGETVKIKSGENRFRFRQQVIGERMAEFTARATGFKDTLVDNNVARGLVFSNGKPRILLVDSDPKQARFLASALDEEGIKVDIRPTQGIPDSLADLQNYEVLVLSNVPATSMSTRQMNLIRSYVQDLGGGLIMIGGDQAFGLGGYYKTTIEEILPVRSDFEKEKEKPSLAMALVIDKSGSMGGIKIEMAKDAAKAAVELLGPKDRVGVIAFDADLFWVSEMQTAANKGQINDRISTIEAGGGTIMGPPMEAAFDALQQTPAKFKHVIVLTDGVSEPADFQGIAQRMAEARITCSTVAVGDECDFALLEEIARIGNGRYYHAEDPSNIPQIFARETVTASKSAINEQPFTPIVIRPAQAIANIRFDDAPFLLGYVTTRPKPTSELILATEKGDPLLAWWRYGLGMTVAFTSDAKSRWAAEWLSWPGYSKFWAQVVRHAMRKSDAKGVFMQITQKDGKAQAILDAIQIDGKYLNEASTEFTVLSPQGDEHKLTMTQTAPGRYVGDFVAYKPGAYHVHVTQTAKGQAPTQQSRGLVINYDEELRLRPTDETMLTAIASASGGDFKPQPAAVFAPNDQTAAQAHPLWAYLLMAAGVLFLLDVALRRIDFDLLLGRTKPPLKMVFAKR
jgi:Ca-activated chloride channel family protein